MCTVKQSKYLKKLHDLNIMDCFPTISRGKLTKIFCRFKNGNCYITHMDKDANFLHSHELTIENKEYVEKIIKKLRIR